MDYGIAINGVDFTSGSKAKIYGSLQQVLNQQKLELLDPELSEPADVLVKELKIIERRNTQGGRIQISAPATKHDDMPTVLALATHNAIWLEPTVTMEETYKEPTAFEIGMATIRKKTAYLDGDGDVY
jgi:hypothetical protein